MRVPTSYAAIFALVMYRVGFTGMMPKARIFHFDYQRFTRNTSARMSSQSDKLSLVMCTYFYTRLMNTYYSVLVIDFPCEMSRCVVHIYDLI